MNEKLDEILKKRRKADRRDVMCPQISVNKWVSKGIKLNLCVSSRQRYLKRLNSSFIILIANQ